MIINKILNKKEYDMTNKFSYIKRGAKYVIGASVLLANLSSAAFGVDFGESAVAFGVGFGENAAVKVLEIDKDGYYKIGSSADFKKFADLANGEEPDAKGKLINDIEFNRGSVIEDGKLKEGHENFDEWTPIGTKDQPFEGELISCNNKIKKITGLLVISENDYQGLFGCIGKNGKVRNIELNGSYIKGTGFGRITGSNRVGGIAASAFT